MEDTKDMTYQELVHGYRAKGYKLKYYGKVKENRRTYRLYKMVINPRYKKTLLITTGFHGEEFNGPISLLGIFDEAAAFAKTMRVRMVVYICVNPSGFDLHKRYNASNEFFNNDFMRYVIKGGKFVGTLKKFDEPFVSTTLVSSPAKEVRLLQKDTRQYIFPVPAAVLDIHQDHLKAGNLYAYILDRRPTYLKIMNKLKKITEIARNVPAMNFENGRKVHYRIDNDGFIFLHDGTLTDMFYRLGSKFVVCAETNTTLPVKQVCQINLIWIKELIKLITRK